MGKGKKIAVFVSFSGQGGVERMMMNLCEGLAGLGCRVDLLPIKAPKEALAALSPDVNVIRLGAKHTLSSLGPLMRYLKRERPDALLAAKDRANRVAILARMLARVPVRVVVRMGTTVTAALDGRSRVKQRLWYLPMRVLYPRADEIVAVSDGVREDLAAITGLPSGRIRVIPNPVIFPRIMDLAREPVDHPWFGEDDAPVILGVGRLTRQKDFPTLIKAFAKLSADGPHRLVILGEGRDREMLVSLADSLGVGDRVDLPGFTKNPWAYMARASLFVLSSAWEGSPNVLTEAMAMGAPVAAADCPSGPREILDGGRIGRLADVGDVEGLAESMRATLANPPEKTLLKEAVRDYTVETSARRYLDALLGSGSRID
ncbi:MAG: glycosyltransferase [Desulfobacterales bacterium]|nr:glycosyltransferase [Desulfobacterales bacterium]